MAKKILVVALLIFPILLSAQTVKDSTLPMHMFSFHASGHIPAGDIAARYGLNAGAGATYWYKTSTNWLLGAEFTLMFGNKYKEDSTLNGLRDQDGYFITTYGEQMYPLISERGFYTGLRLGKVFPVFGSNPNSGIMFSASAGLLQYKTFFRLEENTIPIIMDEFTKLIDYQTNGFAMNQFIGYMHMDSEQPINFYAGFEFHQAWTKCRRDWVYNLHGPENKLRHDYLFGLRVGWIFPIGKKTTGTYTYF